MSDTYGHNKPVWAIIEDMKKERARIVERRYGRRHDVNVALSKVQVEDGEAPELFPSLPEYFDMDL